MSERLGFWNTRARRVSRRRALGVAGGAGAAAFLIACGGSSDDDAAGTSAEATREAGVISGNQGQEEQPKQGGAITFHHPLTPPLDPVANTSYTTQRIAAFTYPRLLKFKTDRAAEVGRLINGLGRAGRHMAALPVKDDGESTW